MSSANTAALVDDLTGRKAAETVTFALDRRRYEINLNKGNAAALRKALAPYIQAGRHAGTVVEIDAEARDALRSKARTGSTRRAGKSRPKAKTASKTAAGNGKARSSSRGKAGGASKARKSTRRKAAEPTSADIRAWAATKKLHIAPRGRISQAVRDEYLAAHAG